ncbi:purine transporter [Xylaria nigripes]|nr:purine transporter [Xylaria nigripes]
MTFVDTVNDKVARSAVGRWFLLEGSGQPNERKGSRFLTEIRAGVVAFFAMAYILAVNPRIIADSGGPCVCEATPKDPFCDNDDAYLLCVSEVKRDLVTATAAIASLGSVCMGLFSNLPVSVAPGLGLNAYFTYNVVGYHGSGDTPYAIALTATFVEGFIFFTLALLGLRQWMARAIPHSLKVATSVGIGLFLTIIGLTYSEGLGLIQGGKATPLVLAGCPPSGFGPDGLCTEATKMRSPTMWVGIFVGGFLTVVLLMYRVKAAIIVGIALVSIISWPRTTAVTYFPYTPVGDDAFDFFKKVVDFHKISKVLNVQQWDISRHGSQFGLALITFLYVDILDTTGTLYAMAHLAGVVDPKTHDFEGSTAAYMTDSLAVSIGALLGTSPITAFVESGAGIADGGRTGLTAVTTGFCFLITVFFAPIFASIPPWATGSVLVLVGSMMIPAVADINWRYLGDAIPAFVTIVVMPLTYSIAYGLIAGILLYAALNSTIWLVQLVSRNKIVPPSKATKEFWTCRAQDGVLPHWMKRAASGKWDFWRKEQEPVPAATGTASGNEHPAISEPTAQNEIDEVRFGVGNIMV